MFALGIAHRLIRTALVLLHKADHKVAAVYHRTVADLDSSFRVRLCRRIAYLYLIVIALEGLFAVSVFSGEIRQDKDECAVMVADPALALLHRRGCELVEVAVSPHKKLHILFALQKVTDDLVQVFFDG